MDGFSQRPGQRPHHPHTLRLTCGGTRVHVWEHVASLSARDKSRRYLRGVPFATPDAHEHS